LLNERGSDEGALGGGEDGQPEGVNTVGVQALRAGPELKDGEVVRLLRGVSKESDVIGVV
jgi:hypothetical protein